MSKKMRKILIAWLINRIVWLMPGREKMQQSDAYLLIAFKNYFELETGYVAVSGKQNISAHRLNLKRSRFAQQRKGK